VKSPARSLAALLEELRGDLRRHERVLTRTFAAMAVYRFGNWVDQQSPALRESGGRVYGWAEKVTRLVTGVHMDRRVRIGEDFHLIHAEGSISIHPSVVIGDRVGVMHNVTIGLEPGSTGAPVIGDDVLIGVGAVILGPVKIGDRASIAANSLVISDVPADSVAIGVPAKVYPRLGGPRRSAGPSLRPQGSVE
jgi:serine O-acetyltransferase